MDAPRLRDPYIAPSACSVVPGTASLSYAKVAGYALLVSLMASHFVGGLLAFQFAYGLRRFGGQEYVPRVILLSALRMVAASWAFGVTCLTAVILAHRAMRSTGSPVAIDGRARHSSAA